MVFGVLRTAETVSPLAGEPVALSLAAFILTYFVVFGAGTYYILRLIGKGPESQESTFGSHGVDAPPLVTTLISDKGGERV